MNPKQLSDEDLADAASFRSRDEMVNSCLDKLLAHIAWQREQLSNPCKQVDEFVTNHHNPIVRQKNDEIAALKAELELVKIDLTGLRGELAACEKDKERFQWALDNYQEMIELLTTHLDHAIIRHIDAAIQQKEKE